MLTAMRAGSAGWGHCLSSRAPQTDPTAHRSPHPTSKTVKGGITPPPKRHLTRIMQRFDGYDEADGAIA